MDRKLIKATSFTDNSDNLMMPFSRVWPDSHAHLIQSHSRMGSLRMRLVSRMQLSINSLYMRSSVSNLLWLGSLCLKYTTKYLMKVIEL